ncbi:hypothetical protein HYQ46_007035 [Verticillium longisporum]|nr:hypothetical protein HYQ46_007035 [Verticillium longisporum]
MSLMRHGSLFPTSDTTLDHAEASSPLIRLRAVRLESTVDLENRPTSSPADWWKPGSTRSPVYYRDSERHLIGTSEGCQRGVPI